MRGYLAGSGWQSYQRDRTVCGIELPEGLQLASQLPEPIFTPTTKASEGHDRPVTPEEAAAIVGQDVFDQVKAISLKLYAFIAEALKFMQNVMKKKAIVFVLSDFMADDYHQTMKIVSRKHDVTGIRVYDKHETEMPNLGMVQMQDEETNELLLVNTSSKKVRLNYSKYYNDKVNYYKESFTKSGAGAIDCRVDESYVKKLLGYFKRRG